MNSFAPQVQYAIQQGWMSLKEPPKTRQTNRTPKEQDAYAELVRRRTRLAMKRKRAKFLKMGLNSLGKPYARSLNGTRKK